MGMPPDIWLKPEARVARGLTPEPTFKERYEFVKRNYPELSNTEILVMFKDKNPDEPDGTFSSLFKIMPR